MTRVKSASRIVGLSILGLGAALAAWLVVEAVRWPEVERLAVEQPETTAFIERYREEAAGRGESLEGGPVWISYDSISPHLKRAVLVAEDIDFFSHQGFSLHELKEAVRQAWRRGRPPRGASTITQQLAKNLWLSPSRSPLRKLREALLTRDLERHLDKRRIFELYLNVVEFAPGIFGAEAASRRFFGKSASRLNEREAARLAASLPSPARTPPASDSREYRQRVERIEQRMAHAGWLWKVI